MQDSDFEASPDHSESPLVCEAVPTTEDPARLQETRNSWTPDAAQGQAVGEAESLATPAAQNPSDSLHHPEVDSEAMPVAVPKQTHQYPRRNRRPPERLGDYVK